MPSHRLAQDEKSANSESRKLSRWIRCIPPGSSRQKGDLEANTSTGSGLSESSDAKFALIHCCNLIRTWPTEYEAGEFNEGAVIAATLEEYEARAAALEPKVGQLTMENALLKRRSSPFDPRAM